MALSALRAELKQYASKQRAHICQRFFKTKKGEYGEGDIFLGLSVPQQRKIAKKYQILPLTDIVKLLRSKIHEERFTALVLMVTKYQKGDSDTKKQIFESYLSNTKWINNWDLVDTSTPQIVGDYLYNFGDIKILDKLAKSNLLWDRRIAMLATLTFIRKNEFKPVIKISKILLNDKHDLINKAVGWMLRELGKKDINLLHTFLDENSTKMPRTALRYAIEKLPHNERNKYLAK
ncbi:DNA alkylation repair protein [Patescibacteria group bacterium]|nr:DNA alkylation repair protein [Patescibacteria group bacterium]